MIIKLTRDVPIDGQTRGEGSLLDLSPDYAEALIERGAAVAVGKESVKESEKPQRTPRKRKVETPETASFTAREKAVTEE